MPALVTGATGLLGSHVVDRLRDEGVPLRVLVRPSEAAGRLEHLGVEICRGDLGDRSSLQAAVRGVDRVLHCAARTGPWGPRGEYELANICGLEALVEAAMTAGVTRFVHVSSAIVVGADVGGTADETAPLRIDPNPYSWSKVMGERLLERLIQERRLPVTIVRPGLVYGPRDAGSFGRFASMIRAGKMVVMGSGDNHLPLVYVGDVADGIVLASTADQAVGRTYILVNDEPVTQRQYLDAIAAGLGVPSPRRRVPYRVALLLARLAEGTVRVLGRPGPPPLTRFGVQLLGGENRFVIKRAREELGFSPRVGLAEGVRRSLAWYREALGASGTEGEP